VKQGGHGSKMFHVKRGSVTQNSSGRNVAAKERVSGEIPGSARLARIGGCRCHRSSETGLYRVSRLPIDAFYPSGALFSLTEMVVFPRAILLCMGLFSQKTLGPRFAPFHVKHPPLSFHFRRPRL
jgi:hypothetical protein